MPAAPLPADEAQRLAALRSYDVLDTAGEQAFDDLVALAAELTGAPIALVSLIDADRAFFKARHGIEAPEAPRDLAFCSHAILDPKQPLAVPDLREDERFRDNPLVTDAPSIRSYLGVPLVGPEGHALGTFCILDNKPRPMDETTVRLVRRLAQAAQANLELRRAMRRLGTSSVTDALTGLPNRAAAMTELESLLAGGGPVAVIAMDLDHFKEANDAHGHAAGDALLRAAAQRIRSAVRSGDLVARLGGDEFMALLPGVSDWDTASGIAEAICTTVSRPVLHDGRPLRLGVSAGVALAPEDGTEAGRLARLADEALIRSKRRRRGSVGRTEPEDAARMARESALLLAFAEGLPEGLGCAMQPVIGLRDGEVRGMEILARWTHPELGKVPPGEIFAVAARLDRAEAVSRRVREIGFAAYASLRRQDLAPGRIGVNLAAGELARSDVVETLENQVEQAGLSLSCLTVEIMEDAVLDRIAHATVSRLAALRGKGARIVLDDFGTGTSGLAQLLRIPLDALKLDGSFIRRLGTDPRAEKVVTGMIRLAQAMGLDAIAEGVEDEAEARTLARMGCDAVQGHFFAPPLEPEALTAWLRGRLEERKKVVPLRNA
ncbi:putative bifunctional diguanylate cyclase/phosphodiesterase [Sabulicella rubraurantiaca]|uniref:putative bifunctional diguanylate cyclase/phosphodiesterase n=1 Tax=Sabulicella rubraurantiaca TaxID=2811429 RepID=UPI001A957B76|nr:EAL domain-containing protein [Sabulicella rubraurantiaca]